MLCRRVVWLLACAWAARASVVRTRSGAVRGALLRDAGASFLAYQGIPYAEPPIGNLRFQPPVPIQPWSDVLDATEPGPVCPQPEGRVSKDEMSEDCLNLNIFVPTNTTRKTMPVLVYIHGGTFKANSGRINIMFGPQLLLPHEIIHVSINYRLGAMGYLSLETTDVPGNVGLKDLLLALKWIKKNIHKFGGSSITLGGQSSGAAMVHYMLLTNKTTGLIDRAILNSGCATNHRFLSRHPRKHALALAEELGISDEDDDRIMEKLRNANVYDIISAQENLYKDTRNVMKPFAPFVPCIENISEHSILTQDPIEIIEAGIPQNVPILAGINSREGAYMWSSLHTKSSTYLQEQIQMAIPEDIEYPHESDRFKDLLNSIKEFYFGDVNFSNWTLINFYDLISDTQYAYSVGSWVKQHKQRENSKELYYYLFNFEGDLNWAKINFNISFPGVAHTDDIGYYFVNLATRDKLNNLDTKSKQTLENMVTYWSNFIKYGRPSPAWAVGPARWAEAGRAGRHMLLNDRPTREPYAPFAARFAFWTEVYNKYRDYVRSSSI